MTAQVQELINKIKTEGIQEAQSKAKEMEAAAQKKAEEIVAKAKEDAEQIIAQAKSEANKVDQSTRLALQQVARDTLLKLRAELQAVLERLLTADVGEAMTPDKLAVLIEHMAKAYAKEHTKSVEIEAVLSEKDLKQFKDGYLKKLQDAVKHPLTLRSSDNVGAGFTISFDKGKTSLDFSDESLVEFLSASLSAEVSSLLKDAVTSKK